MNRIQVNNCKQKLAGKGIHMGERHAEELLGEFLSTRMSWYSWEYSHIEDILYVYTEGTEIPDMSDIGEVGTIDAITW